MKTLARISAGLLALGLAVPSLSAQIRDLPEKSPHAKTFQVVGVTELEVDYYRPSVRGRAIWGNLVPYDAVWRAGANANTIVQTSHTLAFAGGELPAGTYGLHMIPGRDTWTIAFSHDNDKWGSYQYDPARDALRVTVTPRAAAHRETLEYSFRDLRLDGATLVLAWEKLEVPIPFEVDTAGIVLARIEEQLAQDSSPATLIAAASFALQHEVALDAALEWCEAALVEEESAGGLAIRAGILQAMGMGDEAREGVQLALDILDDPSEIARVGVQMQRLDQHVIAIPFFLRAAEMAPESPQLWNLLGDSQAASGQTPEAIASYRKALELVQDDFQRGALERAIASLQG